MLGQYRATLMKNAVKSTEVLGTDVRINISLVDQNTFMRQKYFGGVNQVIVELTNLLAASNKIFI